MSKVIKALENLKGQPVRFSCNEVATPQRPREQYFGELNHVVGKLLDTKLSGSQAELIQQALYYAFQMGVLSPDNLPIGVRT